MLTNRPLFRAILDAIGCRLAGAHAERGVATFAVAMLAMVATGTTAATLTIAGGDINFDNVEAVIGSSVARVSGTLEVRGSIIARSEDGVSASTVQVPLRLYGEATGITFDPADPERLVIAYYDGSDYNPDVPHAVQMLTGNGDAVLDPWETALITIELTGFDLHGAERFTLELSSPVGGTLILERTLPPILQDVMPLY
jgi:archaellin